MQWFVQTMLEGSAKKNDRQDTLFGMAYDTFFRRPSRLAEKYFDFWMDLELTIAGPLSTARDRGDIRYVFRKKAIKGVETFDDLMAWMNANMNRLTDRLSDTEATTHNEVHCRGELLSNMAGLRTLI